MIYLLYAWWVIIGLAFLVGLYAFYKLNTVSGEGSMAYAFGIMFFGGGAIVAALITALIQWLV